MKACLGQCGHACMMERPEPRKARHDVSMFAFGEQVDDELDLSFHPCKAKPTRSCMSRPRPDSMPSRAVRLSAFLVRWKHAFPNHEPCLLVMKARTEMVASSGSRFACGHDAAAACNHGASNGTFSASGKEVHAMPTHPCLHIGRTVAIHPTHRSGAIALCESGIPAKDLSALSAIAMRGRWWVWDYQ